mmetsp:Transcript_18307/g.44941  ORF Transcript_18307/g.44941 Transcript_18307/m.44941 type:complete len:742 (-) Transcript_18307:129-2354(-)|eukprot:CAMPEP_0114526296 /NCGR_PEP_ID=MMETSP0109-20121206/22938_1 /TAXON_ID=29199 /ORGANISM="Chlorarachnion reptans, Strain CCCM449" /LENGTH=741 /DNA_ID=CAMNT_0001708047 /DNA_START=186 /DNA_END=2414 /DNA_ORIENTATION=-
MASGKQFTLSASLLHGSGTRDIAVQSNNRVVIAEANTGSVRVWEKKDPEGWKRVAMRAGEEKMHNGLCMVVANLHDAKGFPEGTFMSGGGDHRAVLFTLDGTRVGELKGHKNAVHSVSVAHDGKIVTGCWDGVAREWTDGKSTYSYPAHKNSAVVHALPTGELVTAGGEGDICVYKGKTLVKRKAAAHGHVVRKIVPHPLGFATCGNDGFVKVWSNELECLVTFVAYGEETRFVYGLCALPETNELVTCDDGSTVKVWTPDGKVVQTIAHPAVVRAVQALPNGDFITAGSDGVARIFTRDQQRVASAQEVKAFEQAANSDMEQIDVSGLPTEAELMKPGEKDGQVKVFNVQGKAMVYRWSLDEMKWILVGHAMGQGRKRKAKKTELDGKDYDHVTKVFITEQQSVMLGWNVDDDPRDVVDNFAALYSLTEDLKLQVYQFVAPKTDPQAIAMRKERERRERIQALTKHVPNWQKHGFKLFADTSKLGPMRKRLDKILTSKSEDKKGFQALMSTLENTSKYHSSPFSEGELAALNKMLKWTGKEVLPALDALRIVMQHAEGVRQVSQSNEIKQAVLGHLRDPNASKHQLMLSLRALANMVARRPRTENERKEGKAPTEIVEFFQNAVKCTANCLSVSKDDNVRTAGCVFLSNVICWIGMNKIKATSLMNEVIDILSLVLMTPEAKEGVLYYGLVAVTSAGMVDDEIKIYAQQKLARASKLVESSNKTQAVIEAFEDFRKILQL